MTGERANERVSEREGGGEEEGKGERNGGGGRLYGTTRKLEKRGWGKQHSRVRNEEDVFFLIGRTQGTSQALIAPYLLHCFPALTD